MKRFWVVVAFLGFLFVLNDALAQGKMERGKIVVSIYDDFVNKKSEVKYFLQRKDTTLIPVPMEQLRDFPPPHSGQRAILSPNGKLRYPRNKAGIPFNKISGEINVLIALIQPSGEDAPWEAEKAVEYFQSSKDFFEDPKQHSKITLSVKTVGWVKSQKTTSDFLKNGDINFVVVIKEAISIIDNTVDFSKIDCLFVVVADSNYTLLGGASTLGSWLFQTNDGHLNFSGVALNAATFSYWPVINSHELGHTLGLWHGAGANTARKNNCGYQNSEAEEYYDAFTLMGSTYSLLPTWIQYLFGWLPKERVINLSVSASVELHPREIANADGKQLVIVETYNGNEYFTLEVYVKKLESYFYTNNIKDDSLLILRRHNGVVKSNRGGYDSVVFLHETNDYESFLRPGEEICGLGPKGDISIKYVSLEGEGENARVKVEVSMPEPTPTPSPSPSPSPSPTPTPTPTPTLCEATTISVDPKLLKLTKKTSGEVTVTITGADGCAVEGETVTATINKAGQKRVSISPSSGETDENGQAKFTITAKKVGNARVTFTAGSLRESIVVKVKK